jgi:hypothetical protein
MARRLSRLGALARFGFGSPQPPAPMPDRARGSVAAKP